MLTIQKVWNVKLLAIENRQKIPARSVQRNSWIVQQTVQQQKATRSFSYWVFFCRRGSRCAASSGLAGESRAGERDLPCRSPPAERSVRGHQEGVRGGKEQGREGEPREPEVKGAWAAMGNKEVLPLLGQKCMEGFSMEGFIFMGWVHAAPFGLHGQ